MGDLGIGPKIWQTIRLPCLDTDTGDTRNKELRWNFSADMRLESDKPDETKVIASRVGIEAQLFGIIQARLDATLWRYLSDKATVTHRVTVDNAMKLMALLEMLHKEGIYHRDLHENNIMVQQAADGRIDRFYIIDWGLAHSLKDDAVFAMAWDYARNLTKFSARDIERLGPFNVPSKLVVVIVAQLTLLARFPWLTFEDFTAFVLTISQDAEFRRQDGVGAIIWFGERWQAIAPRPRPWNFPFTDAAWTVLYAIARRTVGKIISTAIQGQPV